MEEDKAPTRVILCVEDQRIPVGSEIWRQFSTLKNLITDMDVEEDGEIPLPIVTAYTIGWVQQFTLLISVPLGEWTDKNIEEMCKLPIDGTVLGVLRQLPENRIVTVLKDLNFLGGGFIYSCVCRYVTILIKENGWDAQILKKYFGLGEDNTWEQ